MDTPLEDIFYDRPDGRFIYRVAGVALENDQVRHHEIGFYFLMHLPLANPVSESTPFAVPDTPGHVFEWCPLQALQDIPLHPTVLRSGLVALPGTPTYIVHHDSANA